VPYVVPASYVTGAPEFERPLGHEVWVTLALLAEPLVTNLNAERLRVAGISSSEAWGLAFENIHRIFTKKVEAHFFPEEPNGRPRFILVGGHPLAASSALMPQLWKWASNHLNEPDLLLSIPQPAALIIFPRGNADQRAAIRRQIREVESKARKHITWELFSLQADGLLPFAEA
jgi:hypothetical protein